MAAPMVEARSLSSLTALASNPPAYPRNPTHVRNEPLVLYIARVPGSKDVFLSPMKPREKVVTAQDIQSSLYFVHFNQPEDVRLVDPPEFGHPEASDRNLLASNATPASLVQRKAVPGTTAAAPMRKPVPGILAPVDNYSNEQNINAGQYSHTSGMPAPQFDNQRRSFDASQYQQESKRPLPVPHRRSENPPREIPSLTLIRRDPASGAQWNVAQIEDPPIVEISSSTLKGPSSNKRRIGAPMYLEIFNPGYSKFLTSETSEKPPFISRDSGYAVRSQQEGHSATLEPQGACRASRENTFRRRIWLEGSQHLGNTFGHRKNNSYEYNNARPSSKSSYTERPSMDVRPPMDLRSLSPPSLTHEDQAYGSIQVSDRQTSFRGYVFTSPWNGRCEFATGVGGGSLKCRHIVPGLQGAPPTSASLSELRFNLPSGPKKSAVRGLEASKRSSIFRRNRPTQSNSMLSSSGDEDPEDRLDLSLGQEFAGGGLGGKQAKLGKIILEDEGLKMMDLLVAANLALWWRAYEKTSGGPGPRNDSMDL